MERGRGALLGTERVDRTDAEGSAERKKRREESGGNDDGRRDQKGRRVYGVDAVEKTLH